MNPVFHQQCDRCSSERGVTLWHGCPSCGPIPLCSRCIVAHQQEVGASEKAIDAGVVPPMCKSCGIQPEPGIALINGKPASWFSRTIDSVTEYACSRGCIPEGESILPW